MFYGRSSKAFKKIAGIVRGLRSIEGRVPHKSCEVNPPVRAPEIERAIYRGHMTCTNDAEDPGTESRRPIKLIMINTKRCLVDNNASQQR
jgi:hypothetical protein